MKNCCPGGGGCSSKKNFWKKKNFKKVMDAELKISALFYCKFSKKKQGKRGKKRFFQCRCLPNQWERHFHSHFGFVEGPPGPIRRKKAVFLKAKKGSWFEYSTIRVPSPPHCEHALAFLRSILDPIDPNFGGLHLFDHIFSLHSTAATDWPGLVTFFFFILALWLKFDARALAGLWLNPTLGLADRFHLMWSFQWAQR